MIRPGLMDKVGGQMGHFLAQLRFGLVDHFQVLSDTSTNFGGY